MSSRHLANNSVLPLAPLCNLLSPSDLLSNNCFHINSYEKRRNITASFDTGSLQCTTCLLKSGHQLLEKVNSRSSHSYKSPAVFILSDQSFPASLPTSGEGECLHVLCLEDATLADLTNILLDTLKPFCVPAGTVVLLHSVSHLAWVGPAAYTEDLVRARQRICGTYRTGILVLHVLPLLPEGSSDTRTWSESGSASVGHIELAFWYFTDSPFYQKVARTPVYSMICLPSSTGWPWPGITLRGSSL